ncbi:hypothetical protein Mal65_28940 [Crateriforma conspicua]|nr:hypothetical protein Mal65_28940 [Crateriforma conspicua]
MAPFRSHSFDCLAGTRTPKQLAAVAHQTVLAGAGCAITSPVEKFLKNFRGQMRYRNKWSQSTKKP